MTDRERIQRIFSGEPEQMSELIEEYYQDIFQYCYSQTRRESAAYDCTQETFLRVIRYLNRYVEQKKFRAYLLESQEVYALTFSGRNQRVRLDTRKGTKRH